MSSVTGHLFRKFLCIFNVDELNRKEASQTRDQNIEMMLHTTTKKIDVYNVEITNINKNFSMSCEVNCVDRPVLLTLQNPRYREVISELKQVTFLTTRTSTGSKVDVFHQSQPLTQSSDVTRAVRVVKNVTCLSSLSPVIDTLKA
jgi:hypothetical protein